MNLSTPGMTQRLTVSTAAPEVADAGGYSLPFPLTLTALPGSGGTLLVEYQTAGNGVWTAWPDGMVSAKTVAVLNGPVYALRFTAAVANGIVEVAQ